MSVALPPIDESSYNQHREGRFAERTAGEDQQIASLGALEQGEAQRVQQSEAAFAQRTQAEDAALAQHAAAEQEAAAAPERAFADRAAREDADIAAAAAQEQRIVPPGGSGGTASDAVPPSVTGPQRPAGGDAGGYRAYARQAAQRAGFDPDLFERQIQQESGFDPTARSGAGAQGIAQIVPSAHPGVDPSDPRASLDYAANWMASLVKRYGGDVRRALAAYNAGPGAVDKYGDVPPFEETQRYVKTIYDDRGAPSTAESVLGAPPSPGAEKAQYATARAPARAEAVGQFEQGLDYAEAAAICGPVAALAFAQANGRNPSLAEARAFAVKRGWTAAGGMNGVANEQALLSDLGVKSRLDTSPDFGEIAQDAASGNPVIISTPVHYYYANAYDQATGRVFVGKTGTSRRGGGSWMTPQQIAELDGGINGVLYVDSPRSPTPSVAAADTGGERPPSEFEPPSRFAAPAAGEEEGRYLGPAVAGRVGYGDVGLPSVADELPRTPAAAYRAGSRGLANRVEQTNADQAELFAASGRALDPGSTEADRARALELAEPYALALTGEPLRAVGMAGRAAVGALGIDRALGQAGMSLEEAGQRALPPLVNNYLTPLSAYADRLYHETGAGLADEFLPLPGRLQRGEAQTFLANTPEMALGQGNNRGVLLEFDAGGIQGQVNTRKPMWQPAWDQGHAEFVARGNAGRTYEESLRSVTVKPDVAGTPGERMRLRNNLARLEQAGWSRAENADGSVTYRRPEAATGQPGMSLGVTGGPGDAGGTIPRPPPGVSAEVERLRLDKFPEDVRDTIAQAAERGDFWQRQRRNVIPDAEAERMADEIGKTADEMIAQGRAGRAWNTEETRALRNSLTGQAVKVDDLKQTVAALGDQASDALRRELGQAEATLLALSRVAEGARAEAGRAFRAYLTDTRGRLARAKDPGYTSVSRVPTAPPPVAPGRTTPGVTEQAPLITEPVATSGRATNLLGQTTRVGAGARSVYDRASLVRMAGMLSGVPTHLLNIAGNAVQGGATLLLKEGQVAADLARVGVGRRLGKDVQRTRFQAEVGPQVAGYARGLRAGVQQIPGILTGNLPQDFARNYDARGLQSGSTVLDAAVEMPLRALAASDAVFRSAAFGGHAAALATRQATREGLSGAARSRRVEEILGNLSDYPVLLDNANQLAARDVFQEARVETDAIARFKRQHVGAQVAGDVFLPFYRTPYNVAAQGAGMTPAGYLGALAAARRGETGEAVDRAVRATVGTMALGGGLELARNNLLTGAYPADASDRSTLPEGWKPYSLRIPSGDGAVYVPIQSLGALAVPLGAAAVVVDAEKRGMDKNDLMKGVYAGLGGIGQFMGDMSALQGLNAVFKLATAPERTVESFSESLGASFVPGSALGRQVQQLLGDAARDPTGPVEAFMAGIPGLSQFVPEKTTPLGDTRARGPSGPAALVAGGRIGVERDDPALATLRGVGVGIPADPTEIEGVPLTPEEQAAVRQLAGERIRAAVARLAANDRVAAVSPAVRADIYRNAVEGAREQAKSVVWKRIGAAEIRRRRAAQPAGVR